MSREPININLDIAIVGGGVAGLWLLDRLRQQGYDCALFESNALGSGQTMASQGMIHGGMKYTLSGALTGASETIADMPLYWRRCLCGEGDVDLRSTRLLSDHFFLWSTSSLSAKLSAFLASKAVRGRADPVDDRGRPPLLRHADFNGSLYKLVDIVIDVHSLIANLARNLDGHTFSLDPQSCQWHREEGLVRLSVERPHSLLNINAKRFVFCAGKGNAELLAQLHLSSPAMQLRPLQQVLVKHQHPYTFFGHCLGGETTPRLTISSHKLNAQDYVWYLGGKLAEEGVALSGSDLIEKAKTELSLLFPWVNFSRAEWATLAIERAEPLQPHFARPENAFIEAADGCANLLVGWPTKLTLAPNFANQALNLIRKSGIVAAGAFSNTALLRCHLSAPAVAKTPWETAFPPALSTEQALELKFPPMVSDE